MKRTVIGILVLTFAFPGCDRADKKKDETAKSGKIVTAPETMSSMRTELSKRRPATRVASRFKELEPLAKMLRATKSCERTVFFKCAEGKKLESWTKDVWMNKVKLSDSDKIRAWKTAATLVLHPDKKVRNFAAGVFQLDPFGLRGLISKNPALVHVRFVKNLLKALPTLETFRSGWLMSYVPYFAPAYGLLADCFKAADQCMNKNDLYGRILKGFPRYSKLKYFSITKKYAKDTGAENIMWATAALEGLLSFRWTKKEAEQVCYWLKNLLPVELSEDQTATTGISDYVYRYVDLAMRCKVLDSEKHLSFVKKMRDTMKMLKGHKFASRNYKKKMVELKDHFAIATKKLNRK